MTAPSAFLDLVQILPPGRGITMGLLGDSEYGAASGGTAGGWQIVDRPRLVAATQWFDRAPWQLSGPAILDGGFGSPSSVELQCQTLEGWMDPAPGQEQPAVLQVRGPVPGTQRPWVLQAVTFKAAIRDPATEQRTQQQVQLTLWEYVPTTSNTPLVRLSPAQMAQRSFSGVTALSPASRTTYTVRQGDTLGAIAARLLGDASLWTIIASANGIRDPANIRAGQLLAIP